MSVSIYDYCITIFEIPMLHSKLIYFLFIFVGISVIFTSNYTANGKISKNSKRPNTTSNNLRQPQVQTLQGKLIYEAIPPIRSVRSYKNEEFFLIINPKDSRSLVLRPSEKVSESLLQSFHNRQVQIQVVYREGIRPSHHEVACPLDSNGQCMPQGEGYQVLSIKAKNLKGVNN
jgi:hypothetical protein